MQLQRLVEQNVHLRTENLILNERVSSLQSVEKQLKNTDCSHEIEGVFLVDDEIEAMEL